MSRITCSAAALTVILCAWTSNSVQAQVPVSEESVQKVLIPQQSPLDVQLDEAKKLLLERQAEVKQLTIAKAKAYSAAAKFTGKHQAAQSVLSKSRKQIESAIKAAAQAKTSLAKNPDNNDKAQKKLAAADKQMRNATMLYAEALTRMEAIAPKMHRAMEKVHYAEQALSASSEWMLKADKLVKQTSNKIAKAKRIARANARPARFLTGGDTIRPLPIAHSIVESDPRLSQLFREIQAGATRVSTAHLAARSNFACGPAGCAPPTRAPVTAPVSNGYPYLNAPLNPTPQPNIPYQVGGAVITNQAFSPQEMLHPHSYRAMYPPYYYRVKGHWKVLPFGVWSKEDWKLMGTEVNVNYKSKIGILSGFVPSALR